MTFWRENGKERSLLTYTDMVIVVMSVNTEQLVVGVTGGGMRPTVKVRLKSLSGDDNFAIHLRISLDATPRRHRMDNI